MAFVTRSQKVSPFTQTKNDFKQQLLEKDDRIHHKSDDKYRKLLAQKKFYKENTKSQHCYPSSIPSGHQKIQGIKKQRSKKNVFNIRDVRKYKIIYRLNQTEESLQKKDMKEFYDLPGSLQSKTLVNYGKNVQSKQFGKENNVPGPGTYNPKITSSVQTPVFNTQSQLKITPKTLLIQEQAESKKEKLFAVKYNCMSTCAFKKSPNLLRRSNKFLLNKLFHHKNPSQGNMPEFCDKMKEQFEKIEQKNPDPTSYHARHLSLNKNSPKFAKAERFVREIPCGPPKFYNKTEEKQEDPNQTPCFTSVIERFKDQKQFPVPLQYSDYEKSLLRQSKNVKNIGFNSNIYRSEEKQIDQRPYYQLETKRAEVLGKFDKNQCQRIPFQIKQQLTPCPFTYNQYPKHNQKGFSIPKYQKPQTIITQEKKENKQNLGASFYLCSESSLNKKNNKMSGVKCPNNKGKKADKKTRKAEKSESKRQYNVSPEWQKRSFNRYFTNEMLSANNPIQYRI